MSEDKKKVIEVNGDHIEFTPYGEFLSYFHAHLDLFKKFLKAKGKPQEEVDETVKKAKSFMTANVKKPDHFFERLSDLAAILNYPKEELSQYLNSNFIGVLEKVQEKLKKQELEKKDEPSGPQEGKVYTSLIEEIAETVSFSFPKHHKFKTSGMLMVLENTKTGEVLEPQGLMAASVKAAQDAVANAQAQQTAKETKIQEDIETSAVPLPPAPIPKQAPPPPPKKEAPTIVPETSILQDVYEAAKQTLTGKKLTIRTGPDSDIPLHPQGKTEAKETNPSPPTKIETLPIAEVKTPTPPPPAMEEEIAPPSFDDFDLDNLPTPEASSTTSDSSSGTDLDELWDSLPSDPIASPTLDSSSAALPEDSTDSTFDFLEPSSSPEPEQNIDSMDFGSAFTETENANGDPFGSGEEEEEEILPRRREPVASLEEDWESSESESPSDSLDSAFSDLAGGEFSEDLTSDPFPGSDSELFQGFQFRDFYILKLKLKEMQSEGDSFGMASYTKGLGKKEKLIIGLFSQWETLAKEEKSLRSEQLSELAQKSNLSLNDMEANQKLFESFFLASRALDAILHGIKTGRESFQRIGKLAWPYIQQAFISSSSPSELQEGLQKITERIRNLEDRAEMEDLFQKNIAYVSFSEG